MKIHSTSLADLCVVEAPVHLDTRGSFQRLHSDLDFASNGLPSGFIQTNLSTNINRGTLRGLHYQRPPHREDKLVRCVGGAILDVALDLRRRSPTFGRHFAIELSAANALALLIPKGFAHGYLTLTEGACVLYHVTAAYQPAAEAGVRWNDPFFAIDWPIRDPILSAKDAAWPDFAASSDEC